MTIVQAVLERQQQTWINNLGYVFDLTHRDGKASITRAYSPKNGQLESVTPDAEISGLV